MSRKSVVYYNDEFHDMSKAFTKKGNVFIMQRRQNTSHVSIITDRDDVNISISSPRSLHMSQRKLVELYKEVNTFGIYAWKLIRKYTVLVNDPLVGDRLNNLSPKQSYEFVCELVERMCRIINEAGFDVDSALEKDSKGKLYPARVRDLLRTIYKIFGSEKNLDMMILEIMVDILDGEPTEPNICRTCKHCKTLYDRCGHGQCDVCTFSPSHEESVTINQFRSEYGKHVYAEEGKIFTDITSGCEECEDYYPRPVNIIEWAKYKVCE